MFNKIFVSISRLLDLENLPLYFSSTLYEDLIPVLKGIVNPEISSLKQFSFIINGVVIYIVRGDVKDIIIPNIFIDNNKSMIICINNNFLDKNVDEIIKSIEAIYNSIFTYTKIDFYPNMSKIFTLFTISKYILDVDISKFNFDSEYNKDKLMDMYKDYTIDQLFDHNKIFTVCLI